MYLILLVQQAEISDSQDEGVRRFQEIIESHLEGRPESIQELLISLRARSAIAERKREQLNQNMELDSLSKSKRVKAAQAKIDHYQNQIQRLEAQTLEDARKQREKKSKKKSKPK